MKVFCVHDMVVVVEELVLGVQDAGGQQAQVGSLGVGIDEKSGISQESG